MKVTKQQVLQNFRELWNEAVQYDPSLRGDTIAKREEFNNYIDGLHKDGVLTDKQVNWSNPF